MELSGVEDMSHEIIDGSSEDYPEYEAPEPIAYKESQINISLGGDKLFIEQDKSLMIISLNVIDNVYYDESGGYVYIQGAPSEYAPQGFHNNISCYKTELQSDFQSVDVELTIKTFEKIVKIIKQYYNNNTKNVLNTQKSKTLVKD